MQKNKKIILTGSSGFIGSNFIRRLVHQNLPYNIIGIDNLSYSQTLDNIYYSDKSKFYSGDICDYDFIDKIFKKEQPDYVINLAAQSHVDLSIDNAKPFVQTNVVGTQVLIDACLKYNVKKMIYASTDEVLGSLEINKTPWTEESKPNPRNPYSASKYAGELMLNAAGLTHGLNYNITRSCNNIGSRQRPINLVPKVIKNILNDVAVPIYGDGLQSRSYIHVDDNIDAILCILENGKYQEVYNIDAGFEISNIEMFNKICNVMGKGFNLLTHVEDRKGHDRRYACNSNKLRSIGWEPKVKFKDAVESTVSWYTYNQWFLNL